MISGVECAGPFLTVRRLFDEISRLAARGEDLDKMFVHFLNMEDDDDDVDGSYATHADIDCFDTTTGDPDTGAAIRVLSIVRWPSRDVPKK